MRGDHPVRLWCLRAILVSSALILSVLLGELAVRMFAPQMTYRFPVGLFQNHPTRGFSFVPGFHGQMVTPEFRTRVDINSRGLRDSREIEPKPDDVTRILFVGDSFTSILSVEENQTWIHAIGKGLRNRHPDRKVEVLNAGVPGYNTFQEVDYLQQDGFALSPDLVVLAFFVGNDIVDNRNKLPPITVTDGYLVGTKDRPGALPYPVRSFLQKHSQLYHLAWPLLHALTRLGRASATPTRAPDYMGIYRTNPSDDVARGLIATRKYLKTFRALLYARKVPGLVAIIPDPLQVGANHEGYHFEQWDKLDGEYQRELPSKRVQAICQSLGIPVFDLFAPFTQNRHPERLYFPVDGHWTVAGNELAGESLLPAILKYDIFQ